MSGPDIVPWTRRELTQALRRKGWTRMSGPSAVYVSPDDPMVHFHLDEYRHGLGVLWTYFAARRELPVTTKPPF